MRAAVLVSLLAAVTAEAPYYLPRPAAHAPSLQYPSPPPQQYPPLQHNHHHGHSHSTGYHYQQPSIAPTFIQPAPQPQYIQPQLAPQPQYIQPQVAPQPQYIQPQPTPQPQYIQPQPQYQQQSYPLPQPQSPLTIPGTSYGVPQLAPQSLPQLAPQPLPQIPIQSFRPLPALLPQPSLIYRPTQYNQQQQLGGQQGYSYQQPQPQLRIAPQLQLQSQNFGPSSLSSYQADTNLYNGAQGQTHREVFDTTVLDRVQNLIKENEHATAKNAGYLSLVSGVSLENAQPSVEISSFTQKSALPVSLGSYTGSQGISETTGTSALAPSAPSQDYGLPTINANTGSISSSSSSSSSSSEQISSNFLPQSQPAAAYGPPN